MKIYYNSKLKQISRDLRKNSTLSEVLLWNKLKVRKMLGYQFMRQKPIGNYIVDFFCSKLKLVIEIDGDSHIGKEEADKERQSKIEKLGITFLRFDDIEVKKNIEGILITIKDYIEKFEKEEQPPHPL
jgi:very-short-patch-repair endonuclease